MIEVFVLDDHPIVRQGLERILEEEADMRVGGQAGNYLDLMELLRSRRPDVIILDITMPDRSGLDVLKDLRAMYPDIPVLIMSVHDEKHFATRTIKAGAAGYLNKMSVSDELVTAIRRVVSGRKYISLKVAEQLAEELDRPPNGMPHEALSDREFQVMCMIAGGMKSKEIADQLGISHKTVSTYRERLLRKMGMRTNTELAHYAVKNQIID
ncbi:MAG: response regulator transcription factor [Actinomycetota bacterium]